MTKNLDRILAQLIAREPIFHRWEHLHNRAPTRADFESLTAADFFEIGASGRIYSRDVVLSTLEQRYSDPAYVDAPWKARDFRLRQLAHATFLLSYTLVQNPGKENRVSRRTTIWQQTPAGWKILFHQGTLAPPE